LLDPVWASRDRLCPQRGFTSKTTAYTKIYRRTKEIYRRKNNVLQEAYRRRSRAILAILRV